MDNKLRTYRVVFSNGVETTVSARSVVEMKAMVWRVWGAFWWKEESVVVESLGERWVAERTKETGWWPKWKEVR